MNNREYAERIVSEHQAAKAKYAAMEMAYTHPLGSVTVDELTAHMDLCNDASKAHGGVTMKWEQFLGQSVEEIYAAAASKQRSSYGRKGFAVISDKYGKSTAKKIISKGE